MRERRFRCMLRVNASEVERFLRTWARTAVSVPLSRFRNCLVISTTVSYSMINFPGLASCYPQSEGQEKTNSDCRSAVVSLECTETISIALSTHFVLTMAGCTDGHSTSDLMFGYLLYNCKTTELLTSPCNVFTFSTFSKRLLNLASLTRTLTGKKTNQKKQDREESLTGLSSVRTSP